MFHGQLLDGNLSRRCGLGNFALHTESLHVDSNLWRLVPLHGDGMLVLSVGTAITFAAIVSVAAFLDDKQAVRLRTGDSRLGHTSRHRRKRLIRMVLDSD